MITKKIIPILLVLSLIAPNFVLVAQASATDSTKSFASCAGAGYVSNKAREGLVKLETWVTKKLKGWLKSKIGGALQQKVPVTDEGVEGAVDNFKGLYGSKEGIMDIIARCGAREILTAMNRNITNVARTSGRNGGPAWVRNWRNFQLEGQYRGEGVFRGMLASSKPCDYFGNDLKGLFGAKEKVDLTKIKTRTNSFDSFNSRVGCTMPNNFDVKKYQDDFAGNGGWDAWSRMLEPQNNFYGALFMSLDEVAKQRAIEESADVNEAAATGFTSKRGKDAKSSCSVKSKDGRCLIYKDILTPGGILSGAVMSGIESELQWVASTDELNELIASGINLILNRLTDLSNPNEGELTVPGDIDADFPPFVDVSVSGICNKDVDLGAEFLTGILKPLVDLAVAARNDHTAYGQQFFDFADEVIDLLNNLKKNLNAQPPTGDPAVDSLIAHAVQLIDGLTNFISQIKATYRNFSSAQILAVAMTGVLNPLLNDLAVTLTALRPTSFCQEPTSTPPPDGTPIPPPPDADTKHGNHTAEVAAAKQELIDEGKQFPEPGAVDECFRFEIVKRAVPKIGDGAGYLDSKPPHNNCGGFAVDIIAFPDGYIYDVLTGGGDGSNPAWDAVGCETSGGGISGTCPDRYRAP